MLTCDGPKVVEFNVRFGDPEAQVVLPLVQGELGQVLMAAACGRLAGHSCPLSDRPHVGVVLASGGYPGEFQRGRPIHGEREASEQPGVLVFHAGTTLQDGRLVTSGGRVLTVVGSGDDYAMAIERAYAAVSLVSFEGVHVRRDIGRKALARPRSPVPYPGGRS
jgi:phosphoribosylamine--glycine ligase